MQNYLGFNQTFRVTPMVAAKPELEDGGKIILPPSALGRIAQLNLVYPLMFQLTNKTKGSARTHAGVLEFTAEEGRCYVPFWMMQNIGLEPNDFVHVSSVALPRGSFVKFKPKTVDFLDISDPRAVLEHMLRKYSALTVGETVLFRYNDKDYYLEVLEAKPTNPQHAISVIETDVQVDFAPPDGYVEPNYKQNVKKEDDKSKNNKKEEIKVKKEDLHELEYGDDDSEEEEEDNKKKQKTAPISFTGQGYRISGKPIDKSSATAASLSKSPTPEVATSPPSSGRQFITSSGRLVFGSPQDQPSLLNTGSPQTLKGGPSSNSNSNTNKPQQQPAKQTGTGDKTDDKKEENKSSFTAFAGKGYSLK